MTRNLYEKLCKYIHCSDPTTPNHEDKLDKLCPLLKVQEENLPCSLQPWEALSIDEAMITFDDRLQWKQYMPKKPVKCRIKM
ncbi:UNVERIFIED_CONTAM: hypothetical protein FKN15_024134 [Acipenser sinensis]